MNLKEQDYVVTLARLGSITKAAEQLYISQPTLSIYISNLEKEIGTRLFDRIGKRFVLTYAGELYVRRARDMLYQNDQFMAELSDIVSGYRGRLRVGIHSRRSEFLLPVVLMEFRRLYPQVEVILHEISSKTMEDMLRAGELDIIITNLISHSEGLVVSKIYSDQLLMVTSLPHPVEAKAKWLRGQEYRWVDLKDVEYETFILQTPYQSTRVFTDNALKFAGVKPSRTFVIENMKAASQLAAEGFGVAFSVKSYAKNYTYYKPMSLFLVGDPAVEIDISVAYNAYTHLTAYAKDFIELVSRSI